MKFAIVALLSAVTAEDHDLSFQIDSLTFEGHEQNNDEAGTIDAWSTYTNDDESVTVQNVMTFGDYNEETDDYESGRIEEIKQVSDYLYYSLDTWGQQNTASDQPQCDTNEMCGGLGFNSQNKCCAAISISERWSERENYYIYRCLDRGLVEANLNFQLEDNLAVNVRCDENTTSAAIKVMATMTAAAAVATTFF